MGEELDVVIITGMSGAGKSVAMQSMEDLGYFCVDNLPHALLPKFLEIMKETSGKVNKVALVMDLRGGELFDKICDTLDKITGTDGVFSRILFLDAKDITLITRYKETRRSHPLALKESPLLGIQRERVLLQDVKARASLKIDTTELNPKQLREKMLQAFSTEQQKGFFIHTMSFGFKYGIPLDADLVFDVRFLPNPFYVEHMRVQTGLDEEVATYVFDFQETKIFVEKLTDLISFMLPQYKQEGKNQLTIAIGCTGGQHRSVALAEYLSEFFNKEYVTYISHRDIEKRKVH
jgi:RNase adapter protein RapZ